MSEPTVRELVRISMETIARLNESNAMLEDELQKYRALHPYFESADRMLELRDLHAMILLDGNMPQFPKAADKLRAFIDRYREQGEELKRAKAMLTRVTTADAVDDLFSAKTECLLWLDANPERSV